MKLDLFWILQKIISQRVSQNIFSQMLPKMINRDFLRSIFIIILACVFACRPVISRKSAPFFKNTGIIFSSFLFCLAYFDVFLSTRIKNSLFIANHFAELGAHRIGMHRKVQTENSSRKKWSAKSRTLSTNQRPRRYDDTSMRWIQTHN